MIIPDVNLLLYATITAFPVHVRARTWWEEALNGSESIGLASPAIFGFLRIGTNRRAIAPPLAVTAATGLVRTWLVEPNVSFILPGPDHLDIALGLLDSLGTGANLTTDVQLAAYAIERGAELCSYDSDFGRFPGLRWTNPLP